MKNHNIPIVLISTVFAVLVWFSVSLSDRYQIQVNAPLVVRSLPPGKAISSPLPREVNLTFNDYGWRLVKLTLGAGIEWVIDLNTLSPHHRALTLRDFVEQRGGRLGIQPIAMNPDSLYFTLDNVMARRIPVEANYTATFSEGYGMVGMPVIQPESVTVRGAQSLVQRIAAWPTMKRTFESLHQSMDATVPLEDSISTLAFTPEHVTLRLNIQQFAEKTFRGVPIELLSVPQSREIILGAPKLDIVVRGGIEQLAHLGQNDFRATIDYRLLLEDTSGFIQPELSSPGNVQIVKRTPEQVQYVIQKKPQ